MHARNASVTIELALDQDEKSVWLKIETDGSETAICIPAGHAFGLGNALLEAVRALGYEGDPTHDPKVAN